MRRSDSGVGCGACGRGSQPRTREAPGPDRGALRPLREELAGLGMDQGSGPPKRRLPAKGRRRGPPDRPIHQETRTRGQKSPPVERREAPALSQESAARRKTGAPLGAPSPRIVEGEKKRPRSAGHRLRRTRRRLKNTGGEACTIEKSCRHAREGGHPVITAPIVCTGSPLSRG